MKKGLFLAGAVLFLTGSAHAQYDYMNSIEGRWSLGGNFGYALYSMTNVNKAIDNSNDYVRSLGGVPLEKIQNGYNWNFTGAYGVTDYIQLGMEIGMVDAYSENEPFPGEQQQFYVSGLEFGLFGKFVYPVEETFLWTAGLGLIGITTTDAEYHLTTSSGGTVAEQYKGTAAGFKVTGGGEWFFTPNWAVGAEIGYRYAKIEEVQNWEETAVWVNSDGTNFTIDYSGPFAQAGLRFYF